MKTNNRNDSNSFRMKTEDNINVLKLGGTNVLGNALNIKQYFNSPHKTLENIKSISSIKQNQLLTISNDNLQSYKKLPLYLRNKNNNISTDNNYNSDKNILKFINNKNSEQKENNSKFYLKTDNNANNINSLNLKNLNNNKQKFVVLHEIKKIKKKVDLSHRDKSIKNIMDNQIPFDQKNSKIALKPVKLLNNFQDFKPKELINNNMFSFLTEKAKISRKNVLIKLLLEQKNIYDKTTIEHQKIISEMKKNIDNDENIFELLIKNQKVSSRKIEELLEQLLQRKRNLLIEHYRLRSEIRSRLDERQKLLERIDEYRLIAKFVTKALGGRGKLFEFNLTRYDSHNNDIDKDYISGKETQRVLKRFQFLLNYNPDDNYINQDDIEIFNEVTSLNYSDLLFHQLWKKEDFILN